MALGAECVLIPSIVLESSVAVGVEVELALELASKAMVGTCRSLHLPHRPPCQERLARHRWEFVCGLLE